MHRTSILLPEELRRKADRDAKTLGISLGELIRRKLAEGGEGELDRAMPRFFTRRPWEGAGPSDLAVRHDDYLYGE